MVFRWYETNQGHLCAAPLVHPLPHEMIGRCQAKDSIVLLPIALEPLGETP